MIKQSKTMHAVFYTSEADEHVRFDSIWDEQKDAEDYCRLNNKRHTALKHFVAIVVVPLEKEFPVGSRI